MLTAALIAGSLAWAGLPPPPCATELAKLLPGKLDPAGEQQAQRLLTDGTEVVRCQWEAAPGASGITLIRTERAALISPPALPPTPRDLLEAQRELLGPESASVLEPLATPWLKRGEHRSCSNVLLKGKVIGTACAALDQGLMMRFVVLGLSGSGAAVVDSWQDPR